MGNVILIGFMGSGKTTLGVRLSYKMRKPFIDTDKYIENKQKMSVSDIFANKGEPFFRDLETKALKVLIEENTQYVISVGGGLPVKKENRKLLKELGTVIYLKVSAGELYERLKGDTERPLLQCEDPKQRIEELLAAREAFYTDAAHIVIDGDGKGIDTVLEEILSRLEEIKI